MTKQFKSVLTPTQYKYFMMRYKGMSSLDISEKEGIGRNSVNATLAHAAKRLKRNGVEYELPPVKFGWANAFEYYNKHKKDFCFNYKTPASLKSFAHRKGLKEPVSEKLIDKVIAIQEPPVKITRMETATESLRRMMTPHKWTREGMVRV